MNMFHIICGLPEEICFSLMQQPFQSVDLLDPVVGSQRNKIHGNQVFRIVILDTF